MFSSEQKGGVTLLQCEPFKTKGITHGFTYRSDGFGARPNRRADRDALTRALGVSALATMKQVHGNTVETIADASRVLECDGLASSTTGLGLVASSADCVPLLFFSERPRVAAAVHSGWRGTLARIATETVRHLAAEHGASARELHVAIGPAISQCCFEVGDEVVDAFADSGRAVDRITHVGGRGRRHVDLILDNRDQLEASGVQSDRIYESERCTVCENESFYSYRREGQGVGSIMSVIALT